MARVELAADCASNLGESPIWEARSQRLYHIDINGRTLLAYEPATRAPPCRPVALHALVGTIVPRASGGLLACREDDIVPVNPDTGVVGNALAEVPLEHRARPRGCVVRLRGEARAGVASAKRAAVAQGCLHKAVARLVVGATARALLPCAWRLLPCARGSRAPRRRQPHARSASRRRCRCAPQRTGTRLHAVSCPRCPSHAPRLPCAGGPGMRFNDGKCDPQGRLWVGTMHAQYAPATRTCLLLLRLSLAPTRIPFSSLCA
jgi:sugar lactone lactonase YvrE